MWLSVFLRVDAALAGFLAPVSRRCSKSPIHLLVRKLNSLDLHAGMYGKMKGGGMSLFELV